MSRRIWTALTALTIACALSLLWPLPANTYSARALARHKQSSSPTPLSIRKADDAALAASPCAQALAQRAVCSAANDRVLEIMGAGGLVAVTVVQAVQTGAVVSFAASRPSELDVNTPVNPLSLAKLLLAAAWWDNRQPDASFDSTRGTANAQNPAYSTRVSVHEMLVGGSDSAGRQMAVALRRAVGTKTLVADFKRYGFGPHAEPPRGDIFWAELAPAWRTRLTPPPAYISLSAETNDAEWAESLSIGETNMQVTALHVSRFLQAIGNDGVLLPPVAHEGQKRPSAAKSHASDRGPQNSVRVMQASTARRLQAAMRDCVGRGTAAGIAKALADAGWQLGGKTGSGTALLPKGLQVDGWFAGLIFDPRGRARFTVATFVRSGGYGGGNAARISAELARYLIGGRGAVTR